MTITKKSWSRYIAELRRINDKATESMLYYIQEFGMPSTGEDLSEFIYTAFNLSTKYGEAAAALACEMYDATALLSGMVFPAAEPAATATYQEVAKAVVGTVKTGNEKIVSSAVGRLVKMTGVDTTMQNALRDGAWWAWIPRGETCAFCITLASNGWQPASEKAIKNGHAEHIHANCDCTYAVKFDPFSDVEGYEPERYLEMYENAPLDHWNTPNGKPPAGHEGAERNTSKNKINAMRREFYARNKEVINEQKRDNYEKRPERENSAVEEMNIE